MGKMMQQISTVAPALPPRIVLYASEKFGKSSMFAFARNPIFVMTAGETGLLTLIASGQVPPTAHFPECVGWCNIWECIQELLTEPHDRQTLVIDTGNGAEFLCSRQVCDDNFNGDWGDRGYASYGKGNSLTEKAWADFLSALDKLRVQRGMTVVIVHHAKVKTFSNPTGKDFDQWRPEGIEKCWALTHKWADIILRGGMEVQVKDDKVTGEQRCLYTQGSSSAIAGNRYGLPAKITAPAGAENLWNAFAAALGKAIPTPPPPEPPKAPAKKKAMSKAEKAEWFKRAIADAHTAKERTPSNHLNYLHDGIVAAEFDAEVYRDLAFLLCSKGLEVAATHDEFTAITDRMDKLTWTPEQKEQLITQTMAAKYRFLAPAGVNSDADDSPPW